MHSLFTFQSTPGSCSYLPEETSRLGYEIVAELSPAEYEQRLAGGWRRFGHALFRPRCPECSKCLSIRVPVKTFRPNRSQKRAWKANADVKVAIGKPEVTDEKLDLYDRFHFFQADDKGWSVHLPKEEGSYRESFVDNPFATQEWTFTVGDKLVGVGYVDFLPHAMSAIYFFHDPEERQRSLGTFNVLCQIAHAARRRIPQLYLGYFVEGCRSLEYKANFTPNEVLSPQGEWIPFRA